MFKVMVVTYHYKNCQNGGRC